MTGGDFRPNRLLINFTVLNLKPFLHHQTYGRGGQSDPLKGFISPSCSPRESYCNRRNRFILTVIHAIFRIRICIMSILSACINTKYANSQIPPSQRSQRKWHRSCRSPHEAFPLTDQRGIRPPSIRLIFSSYSEGAQLINSCALANKFCSRARACVLFSPWRRDVSCALG